MSRIVLDASAVLAMLLDEPGEAKVKDVLADAIITTVSLSEIAGHYARNGVGEDDVRRVLDPLPFERVGFDEELAYGTAMLLPVTRAAGLSLGDRACLALARRLDIPAMTADRSWLEIARSTEVRVELIR
jgi:PIN domain nuclease of toxin-antitoxin system